MELPGSGQAVVDFKPGADRFCVCWLPMAPTSAFKFVDTGEW